MASMHKLLGFDLESDRGLRKELPKMVKKSEKQFELTQDPDSDHRMRIRNLEPGISQASKKITKRRFKRADFQEAKLLSIGYPNKITDNVKRKQRFAADVHYQLPNGQKRKRLVRFGKKGREEYVDHHDERRRLKSLHRLYKNNTNFLHPEFYESYLLNSTEHSIPEAYSKLAKMVDEVQGKNVIEIEK